MENQLEQGDSFSQIAFDLPIFGNVHHQTVFEDSSWGSHMTRLDSHIVAAGQLSCMFSHLEWAWWHHFLFFRKCFWCKVFHFETWRNWLQFVQDSSLWTDLKWRTENFDFVHFLTQFWGVSSHGSVGDRNKTKPDKMSIQFTKMVTARKGHARANTWTRQEPEDLRLNVLQSATVRVAAASLPCAASVWCI